MQPQKKKKKKKNNTFWGYAAVTACIVPHVTIMSLHLGLFASKRMPHQHLDCHIPHPDALWSTKQIEIKYLAQRFKHADRRGGSNSQHWWCNDHESCIFPLDHTCSLLIKDMTAHTLINYTNPRCTTLRYGSQIRPQLSAANPTNRPQHKVIIIIVKIKPKLWPAAGCEAKIAAKVSSHP